MQDIENNRNEITRIIHWSFALFLIIDFWSHFSCAKTSLY